ncbi:CPBP family intramembrane glutamic endopeptidase [Actinopolyspora halophila]|uniref:CPBP family intramembrane glutamic endopeptidase n=1 Tax=Actinopolyspora halophila TaxID=1850 RepID=UPI0003AB40DE|nr:CPBP family intramembrane glutamic endopeptidase [Actinopolyspora halophila]
MVLLSCFLAGQVASTLGLLVVLFGSGEVFRGGSVRLDLPAQLALTGGLLVGILALGAWLTGKERRPFSSVGFPPVRGVLRSLLLGAVVALLAVTLLVFLGVLTGRLVLERESSYVVGAVLVLPALLGFAVQASSEEILVRGYLVQITWRKWGLGAAVCAQAVVFTLLHGLNTGFGLLPLVNLLLISLVLVFWALAEGGLWGVCAFHAVWNWCQGNVYGIEVSGMTLTTTLFQTEPASTGSRLLTGGDFGLEGGLITTLVLACCLVAVVRVFLRRGLTGIPRPGSPDGSSRK